MATKRAGKWKRVYGVSPSIHSSFSTRVLSALKATGFTDEEKTSVFCAWLSDAMADYVSGDRIEIESPKPGEIRAATNELVSDITDLEQKLILHDAATDGLLRAALGDIVGAKETDSFLSTLRTSLKVLRKSAIQAKRMADDLPDKMPEGEWSARKWFAARVARAFEHYLSAEPSSSRDGSFEKILRAALNSPDKTDINRLTCFAVKNRFEVPL